MPQGSDVISTTEGQTVELKAQVSGQSGRLVYTWFKDGQQVPQVNKESLRFKANARDYDGEYFCRVRDEPDTSAIQLGQPLQVETRPVKVHTLRQGGELSCEVCLTVLSLY